MLAVCWRVSGVSMGRRFGNTVLNTTVMLALLTPSRRFFFTEQGPDVCKEVRTPYTSRRRSRATMECDECRRRGQVAARGRIQERTPHLATRSRPTHTYRGAAACGTIHGHYEDAATPEASSQGHQAHAPPPRGDRPREVHRRARWEAGAVPGLPGQRRCASSHAACRRALARTFRRRRRAAIRLNAVRRGWTMPARMMAV